MNRIITHWFMHPFATPSNNNIISVENKSRGGKVSEYGLLVNKRVISCATSPDGLFLLYPFVGWYYHSSIF